MSYSKTKKSPAACPPEGSENSTQNEILLPWTITPAMRENFLGTRKRLLANPALMFHIVDGKGIGITFTAQEFIESIDDILNKPSEFWK